MEAQDKFCTRSAPIIDTTAHTGAAFYHNENKAVVSLTFHAVMSDRILKVTMSPNEARALATHLQSSAISAEQFATPPASTVAQPDSASTHESQ